MDNVQSIIDKLNGSSISTDEIRRCINSDNILIKSNAIIAIVRLKIFDDKIIGQLSELAKNIGNESHVLGSWNSGHFALAALKLLNTKASIDKYEKVFANLNTFQKEDIDRLLSEWPN